MQIFFPRWGYKYKYKKARCKTFQLENLINNYRPPSGTIGAKENVFRDAISALVGKAGQPLIRFDIFNWMHWKLCLMSGSNGSCLCVYMYTLQSVIHETQQNKIQKLSLRRVFGRQFVIAYRGDIDKILTSHYKRSVSCL